MATMNEASVIDANVEVVKTYLKKEFENFAIVYRADKSLAHIFTVDNGKKQFKLSIGWLILADKRLTQSQIDQISKDNVAEEMRLHGKDGCHWSPLYDGTV